MSQTLTTANSTSTTPDSTNVTYAGPSDFQDTSVDTGQAGSTGSTTSTTTTASGTTQSPFLLSAAEWFSIQSYVFDALQLPTDLDHLRAYVRADSSIDMSQFQPIVDGYTQLNAHCSDWQNNTFPATVHLADDIVSYNTKVPIYYGALNSYSKLLITNPNDSDTQATLSAILNNLAQQADTYQKRAQVVADQITTFSNASTQDHQTIVNLVSKYNDELGANSQQMQELQDELNTQYEVLKNEKKEYEHDVIVASTSATYAWLFPVGTIAAATVAGVYGKRATDAKKAIEAANDRISQLSSEIRMATNLMASIQFAEKGLNSILGDLTRALPTIQKIQGIWTAIGADLLRIDGIIKDDIQNAIPILQKLGAQEAIAKWQEVADQANAYRVNAFIKVSP